MNDLETTFIDDSPYEHPVCPMCGEEFAGVIAKPIRHRIECRFCGERFEVDGNPNVPWPEFKPVFWTDQFRPGREESTRGESDARMDGTMIAIVSLFGLIIVGATVIAVLRPM